ncbi:OmpA family protein [Azospirillum sp.]|uniref:OmpA family protein n=1 Tax=Azospirillum sp. TaxID=34012 RepID=UPI002D305D10|nr:OmpA family protein [Azospirillum sp.]HYD66800.1 OmpA family protein [Azospirillum sp.]
MKARIFGIAWSVLAVAAAPPAAATMLGSNPSECDIARALLGVAGPGCPPAAAHAPAPVPALTPPPPPARAMPAPAATATATGPAAAPSIATPPGALKAGFLINFDFASVRIRPESRAVLDRVAAVLTAPGAGELRFRIVGHTDGVGNDGANQALSERRARAVKEYLVRRHGINAARLDVAGMGEREPADPAHPAAAANRRVEIVNLGR